MLANTACTRRQAGAALFGRWFVPAAGNANRWADAPPERGNMNKCPWCGGEIESGHTEVSGIGTGCHTLDIWYTVCASDNFCGYYSVSDDPAQQSRALDLGYCTCKKYCPGIYENLCGVCSLPPRPSQ